jgi:putative membrane protein
MPWGPGAGVGGTGFGLLPLLLTLVALAVVLVGTVYVLRRMGTDDDAGADAVDVLRRRYARGEVDDDEFERRRARLDGGKPVDT